MRLSSLKLSGFKSFADNTTLNFKENRSAIVGPNGCGKSNVIDAVRWVMGESSARQLRGGTMQDVIFTGTAKRKPVGMASVELRFDNTYGKLGGAYNAYTELAVRRQVTREGKSEYFLNGTKCRRRDITDIFLGTGLGPRSYAIIEQGMINRLVDAKPDEMRVFIEEAAGVSRYQARRRETMQHLEHTAQNLVRLDDIALELKAQLKTLKKQSETARQYEALEQHVKTLKIEMISYQCSQSVVLKKQYTQHIDKLENEFKQVKVAFGDISTDLIQATTQYQQFLQQSVPLQQQWQMAKNCQEKLKQEYEQKQKQLVQQLTQLEKLNQDKQQLKEKIQCIELQAETINENIFEMQQCLDVGEEKANEDQKKYTQINENYEDLKHQYEAQKEQLRLVQQQEQQVLMQLRQLGKNTVWLTQQNQNLEQQKNTIEQESNAEILAQLKQNEQDVQANIQHAEKIIEEDQHVLKQLEHNFSATKQQYDEVLAKVNLLKKEQNNLQYMMAKTAVKTSNTRLLDIIELSDEADETLVEKFLSHWLNASVMENFVKDQPRQIRPSERVMTEIVGFPHISTWIKNPAVSLWNNIGLADTLEQAMAQQHVLNTQMLLTKDGYLLGQDWVIALHYTESVVQGELSYRIRLEKITQELTAFLPQCEALQQRYMDAKEQLDLQQQTLKAQQNNLQEQQQASHQLIVQIAKLHSTQQAFLTQYTQICAQLQELQKQIKEDATQQVALNEQLHHYQQQSKEIEQKIIQIKLKTDTQYEQREHIHKQLKYQQQNSMVLKRDINEQTQQVALLAKDVSFLKVQYQQCTEQLQSIEPTISPLQDLLPTLEDQLSTGSEDILQFAHAVTECEKQIQQLQIQQETLTQQKEQHQQQAEKLRTQLEENRLLLQKSESDLGHCATQLIELEADWIQDVVIDLNKHQQQITLAHQQLKKIGAVNLTASKEYEDVLERYTELTHQMKDLEQTADQLQKAMKNIDRETKQLFMQTFDRINTELSILFPKVFDGGEAYLSLEDDWQSGVKLMARPPGKRNSSLALLSGGEKALTALALVFAIFRLNPAPFCVLDEVDAPLDDANVQRFCNLVKELSEQVQFIYITHNKLAMTMATDLLGVTMPEPGTSKLVTVNLEQAKEYGLVKES